jgi:membrane protein required for colicin V production
MNWLDVIMLIPACWFAYKGFRNGLINEVASVFALVIGVWGTSQFSHYIASFMGNAPWVEVAAFIVTFIIVVILVQLVAKFVEKIIRLVIPALINNLCGMMFGFAKSFIFFSVIFFLIQTVDINKFILRPSVTEKSFLYTYVNPIFPHCRDLFNNQQEK